MANYISYVEVTKAAFPDQPPYQWTKNESAPWTPIVKPLAESKVALIASGGIYGKDQPLFNSIKNDLTFREIPWDADAKDLRISHDFYDHADAEQDVNCVFPIERLRELQQDGFIGKLSEVHFTFMGRIFKKTSLLNEMIPHLISRLQELSIDLAFLVPA